MYVHKTGKILGGGIPNFLLLQISQNIDGFRQNKTIHTAFSLDIHKTLF